MTEKKKPTYDLTSFKSVFSAADALQLTVTAAHDAANLGYGKSGIAAVLQTMQPAHFFTADTVTRFKLLSFKEKENG